MSPSSSGEGLKLSDLHDSTSRAGASPSLTSPCRETETRISRPWNSITASLSVGESIVVSITRADRAAPGVARANHGAALRSCRLGADGRRTRERQPRGTGDGFGADPGFCRAVPRAFSGGEGAKSFLGALSSDPGQSAAGLMPKAAAANRTIFFDRAGAPRSLGGVMELIRSKVASAMEGGSFAASSSLPIMPGQPLTGGPLEHEFHAAALPPQTTPRLSMAETLRARFGANGPAVPASVRSAYGKLAAFGL